MKPPSSCRRIVLMVWMLLVPLAAHADEEGIRVVGSAKVRVAPDMATFVFAIEQRGKDLKAVKHAIDAKAAKLIRLCKRLGVDAKRITSSQLAIRPQYNYQTKAFLGYEVSRDVTVVLIDLRRYTDLVDGAISSGITTVRSISLNTTKRVELEDEALTSAVAAAGKKAEILARSAGITLGKVVSIDEGQAPIVHHVYAAGMSTFNRKGAFEPGQVSVTATVTVRYSIK